MRLSSLSFILLLPVMTAAFLFPQKPVDRPADYWRCQELHPAPYCRIQHLPASLAQERVNGSR
jgi:hypothetical protein